MCTGVSLQSIIETRFCFEDWSPERVFQFPKVLLLYSSKTIATGTRVKPTTIIDFQDVL